MSAPGSSSKRKRETDEEEDDEKSYEDSGGFMDDESEPHRLGTSVLPVANLPNSFDGVPQDGMEYLFTVRREERRLPLVTRAPNPWAVQETIRLDPESSGKGSEDPSLQAIPSEEWRTRFEERFLNLRANMRQPTIHISLPVPSASGVSTLPEMRDRDRWWAFFRGDTDWKSISSSQFHGRQGGKNERMKKETVDYEEALPQQGGKMRAWVVYEEKLSWDQTDEDGVAALSYGGGEMELEGEDGEVQDEEQPARKSKGKEVAAEAALPTPRDSLSPSTTVNVHPAAMVESRPREPTPHLLSLLDQKLTFHLLKYFSQWIQAHFDRSFLPAPPPRPESHIDSRGAGRRLYDLTPSHARWIFALLTRLDAQLTSDEISVLRKLAREVVRLVKEERTSQKLSSQNLTMISSMGETSCWMIVAAVTGVWGQKDLWMDAADALR